MLRRNLRSCPPDAGPRAQSRLSRLLWFAGAVDPRWGRPPNNCLFCGARHGGHLRAGQRRALPPQGAAAAPWGGHSYGSPSQPALAGPSRGPRPRGGRFATRQGRKGAAPQPWRTREGPSGSIDAGPPLQTLHDPASAGQ
eukprot:135763-Pyramimonas_sp.AAC.1